MNVRMCSALLLLLLLGTAYEAAGEPEPIAWPLFEFWNPVTWLRPRFSSEAMSHILRANRESSRRVYQQLKKSLLPAKLFFGNIRTQYAAWDSGRGKGSRPDSGRKTKGNKSQ